jgi:hypothetical protein
MVDPDEVIHKLSKVLDLDSGELFKLAGRDMGGTSFEKQVLSELQRLRRDLKSGFTEVEDAIAAIQGRRRRS